MKSATVYAIRPILRAHTGHERTGNRVLPMSDTSTDSDQRVPKVQGNSAARHLVWITLAVCALMLLVPFAHASGGPPGSVHHMPHDNNSTWYRHMHPALVRAHSELFGIDHRVPYDDNGIWNRKVQLGVEDGTLATVIGGAFLLGDHSKLGDTFWRSLDAVTVSAVAAQVLKRTFQRERPSQTDNPDKFFAGFKYESFPSAEVTVITAAVTPFMARYGPTHPAVYALAALPLYDAIARVKVHGHWQSDVIAGAALGALIGIWATHRHHSLLVGLLPGGFSIGYVHRF